MDRYNSRKCNDKDSTCSSFKCASWCSLKPLHTGSTAIPMMNLRKLRQWVVRKVGDELLIPTVSRAWALHYRTGSVPNVPKSTISTSNGSNGSIQTLQPNSHVLSWFLEALHCTWEVLHQRNTKIHGHGIKR